MVIAMTMVLVAWALSMWSYSKFITFVGPKCNILVQEYNTWGCSNIVGDSKNVYCFTYQGQTDIAYNQANCTSVAHTRFCSNIVDCSFFGWQRCFILC
ncbi:hypothetical protein L7F22_020529 [Adiantum nelumboides]|nr:hypothetical protein [Adiantum nelumboides]